MRPGSRSLAAAFACALVLACSGRAAAPADRRYENFTTDAGPAKVFGVHEISLTATHVARTPDEVQCSVAFRSTAPERPVRVVNAFHDEGLTWRARVYVDEAGDWSWQARCPDLEGLATAEGTFHADRSALRGMLRRHPRNPRQWMTDDGRWFLPVGDTAYRLFAGTETSWQQYLWADRDLGMTFVRAGGFGGWQWDRQGLWGRVTRSPEGAFTNSPWRDNDASALDREAFAVTDRRLKWMLDNVPDMYVEFILFGLKEWGHDNTGAAWRAVPEATRRHAMDEIIARYAAFPQILWQVDNDMHADPEYPNNRAFVREVGHYFHAHDPWQHLMSTGGNRTGVFPFTTAEDDWATFVHLEGAYELGADVMKKYAASPLHVMLAEDHYEQDRVTREPRNPNYFYRWLYWSWLLSGGSAVYGSRFYVLEPYPQTGELVPFRSFWGGQDAHTYTTRLTGLDSSRWIAKYFGDRKIELWRFVFDDTLASDPDGRTGKRRPKLAHDGTDDFIVYHPNAASIDREAAPSSGTPRVTIHLAAAPGRFETEWYRPRDGAAMPGGVVSGGGDVTLAAPWAGDDVVLRLLRQPDAK
jgi:hypothetical protein